MLQRYGEFVVRRARLLLVISGVVLVAAAVFGAGAFGKLKNGGFDDPATQSSQAQQLIDQKYGGQSNLVLLVTAKAGTVDAPSVAAAGKELADKLSHEQYVTGVFSYWATGAARRESGHGTLALRVGHVPGGRGRGGRPRGGRADGGDGWPYRHLLRRNRGGGAGRAAGLPAVLPAQLRLRRDRRGGDRGPGRERAPAGAAGRARPPRQRRQGAL